MVRVPTSVQPPFMKPVISGFPLGKSGLIDSLTYRANGSDTIELHINEDTMDTLYLHIQAGITVSGTAPSGAKSAGIAALLKHVSVKVNDRDTMVDLTAFAITGLALDDYGYAMAGDTALGTATASYDLIVPIDMRLLRSVLIDQTALDPRGIRTVKLRVDLGDIDDLYGTKNTATLDAGTTIDVLYRGTENNTYEAGMHWRELTEERVQVFAASNNLEIVKRRNEAPKSQNEKRYLRSIRIRGVNANVAANVFDETQNIVVKIGSKVLIDAPLSVVRAYNDEIYKGEGTAGDQIYIPFFRNGNHFDALPMDSFNGDLKVIAGVSYTSGNELSVVTEIIRRPVLG